MYSCGPPHMAGQKQDDQHEHTFSSYVRIRDVALKPCQRRWTIGKSGDRGSGISVLAARHDDDDNSTYYGGVHIFPKDISQKVNVIASLTIELAYNDVALSTSPTTQQGLHTYICIYIYIYHHHHHVVPPARISLILSRHFSLSFIASGRSSGLHPVSSHSCCM